MLAPLSVVQTTAVTFLTIVWIVWVAGSGSIDGVTGLNREFRVYNTFRIIAFLVCQAAIGVEPGLGLVGPGSFDGVHVGAFVAL